LASSHVVLDRQILAAHHPIALEPFAAELLGCSLRCVGPFHGHTVVVGVLGARVERVAGDGDVDAFLRVEHSVWRVHVEALRIGRLEGEADAVSTGVEDLDEKVGKLVIQDKQHNPKMQIHLHVVRVLVVEGRVEDHLLAGLG